MSKKLPTKFIIIDDDPISNLLCRICIKSFFEATEIVTFNLPQEGFLYCSRDLEAPTEYPVVLFLDINMPVWSGWDFLKQFEKLNDNIQNQFKIYIMSSSIDDYDINRAAENKFVVDYIKKPFSKNCLENIISNYS